MAVDPGSDQRVGAAWRLVILDGPYDGSVAETACLFDIRQLRQMEVDAPQLTADEEAARDRVWDAVVKANPGLFDGPVAE